MAPRWQDELVAEAARALPEAVRRYVEAGAREGLTRAEAQDAWRSVRLWPRVLRDVAGVSLATTLLGTSYRLPFGVAPTSLQRCAHPDGELAMARATALVGAPHVVSSNAGHRFAEIGRAGGSWWLQVYVTPQRHDTLPVLREAVAAGASAVVLTVDTPVVGTKDGLVDDDFRDVDLSWHRCNYAAGAATTQVGTWARDLSFADIGWVARAAGVPVVAKGVLRPDDARRCLEAGAAAVWVSNHGGRQLDRAAATATALPLVRAAVGDDVEVYVDGGLRSGLDLVTALALGADAAFLGRLPFWALAAGGAARVAASLDLLAAELAEAMTLCGAADPASTRGLVTP